MSKPTCFVMMPFSGRFPSYYKGIFARAIRDVGLTPIKVDEIYTPTQISEDIFNLIRRSEIILADVTGKNPNVNYELGIAHALGKKAIVITQNSEDVPFDYRHLRFIKYDTQDIGWEKKLRDDIKSSLRSARETNLATSVIAGEDLERLFGFLEDTALDASYEVSKISRFDSDEKGNCIVKQNWLVKARSDVSHFIHGIVCDEPGAIRLQRAYDRTNGGALNCITILASESRSRYLILLNKLIRTGEVLQFDFEYSADGFLDHLFTRKVETIFQRPNSRRGVYFNRRKDIYSLPLSEMTGSLYVRSVGGADKHEVKMVEADGKIELTVDAIWDEPYSGQYTYELALA